MHALFRNVRAASPLDGLFASALLLVALLPALALAVVMASAGAGSPPVAAGAAPPPVDIVGR